MRSVTSKPTSENDFSIVVIGCSAGGIAPSMEVIRRLPDGFSAALFLVVHRSSPHELDTAVEYKTGKAARIARDLERIEPGRLYICPGDRNLSLENGIMRVERSPRENYHRPSINALFRSAAIAYGRRVIGVLLSGALRDGAAGLWQIKKHGGLTMVQDPSDAECPSMPQSAIDDVAVDFVLPARNIASKLVEIISAHTPRTTAAKRILIVEDESVVATNLQQALTEMGYHIIDWVPSGEAAVELAVREHPDLILMDIHLAGSLNGIETARKIWDTAQVPIVYCTAHGDMDTLKDALTTENYGYIIKPFQSAAVRAAIELALGRREREMR